MGDRRRRLPGECFVVGLHGYVIAVARRGGALRVGLPPARTLDAELMAGSDSLRLCGTHQRGGTGGAAL